MKYLSYALVILCLLATTPASAVPLKKEQAVFYDNGELHRKITAIEKSIHAGTYFAIAAQTHLSVNTNSSAIINAYNDMRGISANTPIYFVLNNNGGIPAKDMDWFLQEVLHLPIHDDPNLHVIDNKELYELLHFGGPPAKTYYIYNTLLAYKESGKYQLIGDAVLPTHKYALQEALTVPLKSDSIRLSYMDYFMPMSENEMLFLTDIQNKLVTFDLRTGQLTKVYDPGKSGVDYYCDLVAKTQAECDTARKHNSFLEDLNRKNYYLFNMSYDDEHVYVSAGLQVIVRLKKALSFDDDEGGKQKYTIDTGRLYGYGFNIMGVLDRNLQLQKHYIILDEIMPEEDGYLCTECAFKSTGKNRLITSVTPEKRSTPLLAEIEMSGKELSMVKYLPPTIDKSFMKRVDYNVFNYMCSFNGAELMITDIDPRIYDMRYAEPVSSLQGDGTPLQKERIPKYYEESEDLQLNFQPAGMSADDKRLYILYRYKDRFLLEIKNKSYRTVDVINLAGVKGIEQVPADGSFENISLYKNKLYIKYLAGDGYSMTVYDINKIAAGK